MCNNSIFEFSLLQKIIKDLDILYKVDLNLEDHFGREDLFDKHRSMVIILNHIDWKMQLKHQENKQAIAVVILAQIFFERKYLI